MNNTLNLFFSIAGLIVAQTGFLVMYLNAKIGPVQKQIDLLVQYMVTHEGKIATLEERTNPGGTTGKKLPTGTGGKP